MTFKEVFAKFVLHPDKVDPLEGWVMRNILFGLFFVAIAIIEVVA